jgi:hypothetical protein
MDYPPNLALAISAGSLIIPAVYGLYKKRLYGGLSTLFLGITSVAYHSTHNKTAEIVDKVAIGNFVLSAYVCSLNNYSDKVFAQVVFTTVFNATVFFLGKKYNILCFDPDIKVQTFYHMLIHFFSAHTSYIYLRLDNIVNLLP